MIADYLAASEGNQTIALLIIFYTLSAGLVFYILARTPKCATMVNTMPRIRRTKVRIKPVLREPMTTSSEDDMDYEQGVLPLQEHQFPELARRLRETAQRLAAGGRVITSDDVHAAHPIPQGIDPRIMGAAFTPRKIWKKVGYTPSTRGINNARPIAQWQLRGEAA